MAGLILKRPSPSTFPGGSPGFDPGHQASFGAVVSVASGQGNFINLLSGKPGSLAGTPTAFIGKFGFGTKFPQLSNSNVNFTIPTVTPTALTLAAVFEVDAASGNATQQIIATHASAGQQISFNQPPTFGYAVSNGSFITLTALPALVFGVVYFYAVSMSASAINAVLVRLDTGQTWTTTVSGAAPTTTDGHLYIGNRGTNSRELNGGVHAAYCNLSTALSLQQLTSWAKDPWAFWYPQKLDLWAMLKAAVGGTVNPRTLTATCTSTATLTKTAAFLRTLTATATSTSTLIRTVSKTFAATCTSTSTPIRSIAKKLTATCTTSVVGTAIKVILKTLTATCTSTASLLTNSIFARTVTATCTSTAALIRRINKTLTATATSTSTLAKGFAKTLTATCTSTASVVVYKGIQTAKTLIAVCTTSGLVSTIKTLAGSVASLASKLRPYKPLPPPVIPGNDVLFLLNELQKVSNAFNAHVQATKDLDARLKAAGF